MSCELANTTHLGYNCCINIVSLLDDDRLDRTGGNYEKKSKKFVGCIVHADYHDTNNIYGG